MPEEAATSVRIDLSRFQLHVCLGGRRTLILHFNTASRRFYLSVIAFLVDRMKRAGKIRPVALQDHVDLIALLNETVGESAGSSDRRNLLGRIYRKWRTALPNLEDAPLFRVLGRAKSEEGSFVELRAVTEAERDLWANLFEYKGSDENVRLRFSVDRIGLGPEDVLVSWEQYLGLEAWERFVAHLEPVPKARPALGEGSGPPGPGTPPPQLALPDKPSLAVLPFANLSARDRDYFSDGLTEDLITALAKCPDMFVIARNSTFTYKGRPVKVQQVAEDLGVRYVLEGSVQRSGNRVRIAAQLIDARTGHHVWSERYDRELKDVFTLQDRITFEITRVLSVKLSCTGEGARVFSEGTSNPEAYVKLLQGKHLMLQLNKEANVQARRLAEEVLRLDPKYPSAHYLLAATRMMDIWLGTGASARESLTGAIEAAETATALDPSHAAAHALLGFLYALTGEHDKGVRAGELAVEQAPSSAEAHSFLAQTLNFSGQPERALAENEKAFRLTPVGRPDPFYTTAAHTYRLLGRFEEALQLSKDVLTRNPNDEIAHVGVVLACQGAGRGEEARAAAQELLRNNPRFSSRRLYAGLRYRDPSIAEWTLDQLRQAGLPE
jgi:adenylate cyclase